MVRSGPKKYTAFFPQGIIQNIAIFQNWNCNLILSPKNPILKNKSEFFKIEYQFS